MSHPTPSEARTPPAPLSQREILTLFVPLALTSTMMSVSVPIINAGLARLPDPEFHLAAFGLGFYLSIFLESPVFALQQATVAWYRGTGKIRPYIGFALGMGLVLMVVEAVIAFGPAGPFLMRHLMGASEELTGPALDVLKVGVVFPPLVAVRLAFQGILVGRRNTRSIAWGTFLRLILLAILVLGVCPKIDVLGPSAVVAAALAAAVVAEMLFVMWATSRTKEVGTVHSPAEMAGRSLSGRLRFVMPLAATMVLGTLTNPVINGFITRTPDAKTGLAVYSVVASLVWFLASFTMRFSTVTIALGNSPENLRILRGFLTRVVGGVCLFVFLLTMTPAIGWVLEGLIGLTPEMADRTRTPLMFLSMMPLVSGFIAYMQGTLTRADRTHAVGLGALSRISAVVVLGMAGLWLHFSGSALGGILLGAAFLAEMAALLGLLARESRGRAS